MRSLYSRFRQATFRQQISLTVAAGVLLLALMAASASSWEGATRLNETLRQQGENVTASFAGQSQLALLFASAENARGAMQATLAFPDVVEVEIIDASGDTLVKQSKEGGAISSGSSAPLHLLLAADRVRLIGENDDFWHFSAPVTAEGLPMTPADTEGPRRHRLGIVKVTQSKATLKRLRAGVFFTNIAVSTVVAMLFLMVLSALTTRMTHPLLALSERMARARRGERGVRAQEEGAADIVEMSRAFNRMMTVLEERELELIQARDVALAFAQLKAQFAATVSHEIRTPLNGVIGTLDMLMASPLPARQRQLAELAWDSARYLLVLINDVLDFSRLEAGKVELEHGPVDIIAVVEGVIDSLAAQAQQKGLEIGYCMGGDAPLEILGDARRLRQVLTNLAGNAIKFTHSGSVSVWILNDDASTPPALRIEVRDTGPGIAPEHQRRIFESFTQADASFARRHEGSGLGLAISRELIRLMGGEIGVSSQAGHGSTFWISLPTPGEDRAAPSLPEPTRHALVLDASATVQQFCATALPRLGARHDGCMDGASASERLRAVIESGKPYDFVFVDRAFLANAASSGLRSEYVGATARWILMLPVSEAATGVYSDWNEVLPKPLRLQRLAACMQGAATQAGSAVETVQTAHAGDQKRVLVVEDNRTNQKVVLGMLNLLGLTPEIAENGEAAMAIFHKHRWDLILMDCQMPVMDGYETTMAIRAIEQRTGAHVPIIAMTANIETEDVARCFAVGMDDHLAKPVTLDKLRAKLKRWLDGSVPTWSHSRHDPVAGRAPGMKGSEPS